MSEAVRAWYDETVAELGQLTRGDVISTWRARFEPRGHFDDDGRWHTWGEPTGPPEPYDGPRPDLFPNGYRAITFGPGGLIVRNPDGSIIRDRERAQRLGLRDGPVGAIVALLMPSGRGNDSRGRGGDKLTLVQALAWEALCRVQARRAAAREVLAWYGDTWPDDEARRVAEQRALRTWERALKRSRIRP